MEENSDEKIKGGGILPLTLFVVGVTVLLILIKLFIVK
jgi:hypothetical protein